MSPANEALVDEVTRKLLGEPSMGGYLVPTPQPWWKRALRRLFPRQFAVPSDWDHYTRLHLDAYFDWKDRLRILVSGRVHTQIVAQTSAPVDLGEIKVAMSVLLPGEKP